MLRDLRIRLRRDILNGSFFRSRFARIAFIPFVALNYFIIFHTTFFSAVRGKIFPNASFHPSGYPLTTGSLSDGHDYWTWNTKTQFTIPSPDLTDPSDPCATFPTHLLDRIQVVLKTGAGDAWDRTSSQLSSVIRCIPNVLIASDLSHPYGPSHNTTDVLALLPPQSCLKPEDLKAYERQKNATSLDDLGPSHEGWRLDKYKFLPEIEEAVRVNKKADWHVFLESDTYIFWDNLFRLLENYDPKLPYYFGSPSPGRHIPLPPPSTEVETVWFAYGGTGFVLSNPAATRLISRSRNVFGVTGPRVTEEYKEDIQNDCCGDSMLGWALHDRAKVDISGLWPMFNPHGLHGVPFGPLYWCEPVISLHKTHPSDFEKLWNWENSRDRTKGPLLHRDLIDFHKLGEFDTREDWDNADWDGFNEESANHTSNRSFESCREYCASVPHCYQFTWHAHHCWMTKGIRLGHAKDPDGYHEEVDRKYVSGWVTEKIKKWMYENRCEEGAHWVKPSVKRKF